MRIVPFFIFAFFAVSAFAQEDSLIFLEEPADFTNDVERVNALDQEIEDAKNAIAELSEMALTQNLAEQGKDKWAREEYTRLTRLLASLEARRRAWEEYRYAVAVHPAPEGRGLDSAELRELLSLFWQFHTLQNYGISEKPGGAVRPASGEAWEEMARRFENYLGFRFSFSDPGTAAFILRAFLLQGQCYLNGARAYLKENDPGKHLELYELGIRRLDRVIRLCYQARWELKVKGIIELIAADWQTLKGRALEGVPSEKVNFWEKEERYYTVCKFAGTAIEEQRPTSDKAREVLSVHCPWGVDVYFMLKDAHLTKGLDFHIVPTYFSQVPVYDALTPKVCVLTLGEDQVPVNVKREADLFIGDGEYGHVPDQGRLQPVDWDGVQSPLYTIWYISPVIYHTPPSEMLTWAMRALTFFKFSGFAYMTRYLDEFTTWATGKISEGGEGPVYLSIRVFGHGWRGIGMNKRFMNHLALQSGMGGEELNPETLAMWGLIKRAISLAFKYGEACERYYLFEGMQPQSKVISPATSYDGKTRIPPVVIRTMVMGYKKTPRYSYRCMRVLVTYHLLNYGGVYGGATNLDMSALELSEDCAANLAKRIGRYLAREEQLHDQVWMRLNFVSSKAPPRPYRLTEIDFTPKSQVIRVHLDPMKFDKLRRSEDGEEHDVVARLFLPMEDDLPVLETKLDQSLLAVQLFDVEKNPGREGEVPDRQADAVLGLKTDYELRIAREDGTGDEIKIPIRWLTVRDEKTKQLIKQTGRVTHDADEPGRVQMVIDFRSRGILVVQPTFGDDREGDFGWYCEAVVPNWPPELGTDLYEMRVVIDKLRTYSLYARIKAGSKEARFSGWLPLPLGELEMMWYLPGVEGVEPTVIAGERKMKRPEKERKRWEERHAEVKRYTEQLADPGNLAPKPAVHAALGRALAEMGKSYNEFGMYDTAKKAAREALGHLDQSPPEFRDGAFRWEALKVQATAAFRTHDTQLFTEALTELAGCYSAEGERKNSPSAHVSAAEAWASLAEHLVILGVGKSQLENYYNIGMSCWERGGLSRDEGKAALKLVFPNYWAVME